MQRLRFLVVGLAAALAVASCGGGAAGPTTTDSDNPYAGAWLGMIPPGARLQLRLQVAPDGGLTGVLDSIDEGVMGIPLDEVRVSGDELDVSIGSADLHGSFVLEDDRLIGTIEVGGEEQPVTLVRQEVPFAFDRPQEPQPPFPYTAEDVRFPGGDGSYQLAGTLTVPDGAGPFPAVLLVSGSGSQDRDEQLAGHRPFLVLADHLTRAGNVVLRYDDPGYGESGGNLDGTTGDLARDAAAAFRYLADRPETTDVGVLGHSEGGLIAPMVAAAEPEVVFLVLLAGPATSGPAVLAEQTALILEAEGTPAEIVAWQTALTEQAIAAAISDLDDTSLGAELERIAAEAVAGAPVGLAGLVSADELAAGLTPYREEWMRFFLRYDPAPALAALQVPVLALFGEVDLQVPAATNAGPMEDLLTDPASEVEVIPGVNHLFQHSATGRVSEYADLTETIAPEVLERIANWILSIAG